jgi:hypothetical protein
MSKREASKANSGVGVALAAMAVVAIFAAGMVAGRVLFGVDTPPPVSGGQNAVASGPGTPTAPHVTFDNGAAPDSSPSGPASPDGSPNGGPETSPTGESRGGVGVEISAPPPPPPPIPPGALADAERMQREREARGADADRGNGKVTTLVYDFDSEEEKQAWEAKYKTRWETRLKREIDIKIRQLREKIGLSAPQENTLRKVLETELAERSRLVGLLTAKKIGQSDFDSAVRSNVDGARQELKATLTEQQLAAYNELKPREQVLRDETK